MRIIVRPVKSGLDDQIFRRIFRAYHTKERRKRKERERERMCPERILYIAEFLPAHFKKPVVLSPRESRCETLTAS